MDYECIIGQNSKSAEYIVSLTYKQNIGLGNCQKTASCEDSPV